MPAADGASVVAAGAARRLGLRSPPQENHLGPVDDVQLYFREVHVLADLADLDHVVVGAPPDLRNNSEDAGEAGEAWDVAPYSKAQNIE